MLFCFHRKLFSPCEWPVISDTLLCICLPMYDCMYMQIFTVQSKHSIHIKSDGLCSSSVNLVTLQCGYFVIFWRSLYITSSKKILLIQILLIQILYTLCQLCYSGFCFVFNCDLNSFIKIDIYIVEDGHSLFEGGCQVYKHLGSTSVRFMLYVI